MRTTFGKALLLALATTPAIARAQEPLRPRVTVATNPIAIPFGAFSAEIEAAVGGAFTAGVGGTLDSDSDNLSWAQAKLKYYTSGLPLAGFAVGATAGFTHARELTSCDGQQPLNCGPRSESAPMIGVVLDYNWLVGPSRRVVLGAGIGAQRVFTDFRDQIDQNQLDGRLVIGWAF